MGRTLSILLCMSFMLCGRSFSQSSYGIAPLEKPLVNCAALAAKSSTSNIPVYEAERTETTIQIAAPDDGKNKKKSKKKRQELISVKQLNVSAKKTSSLYDPNEVLRNGFTVTLWVMPQRTGAERHGYILYPINGCSTNGVMQSQWGITVDKQFIRIYERYTEERLLLEYRHHEEQDFFIAFTCQNSTPALYVNGELASTGVQSDYRPHPAFEGMPQCPDTAKFSGKYTWLHYFCNVLTNSDISGLYRTEYAQLHKEQ